MKRGMEGTLEALRKKGRGGKRKVAEEEEEEESEEEEGGIGGGDDEDDDMQMVSFSPLSRFLSYSYLHLTDSSSTPPVPTLIFTSTTLPRQPPLDRRAHNTSQETTRRQSRSFSLSNPSRHSSKTVEEACSRTPSEVENDRRAEEEGCGGVCGSRRRRGRGG